VGSVVRMFVPGFMNIGQLVKKVALGDTQTFTGRVMASADPLLDAGK